MSTPAVPEKSRLRSVPLIIGIAVLLGVGLVPIYPSPTEGTVIAIAGLALLVLARVLRTVLTMTVSGAALVLQISRLLSNVAAEADRASNAAERAELEAELEKLDDDDREKVRERIKNQHLAVQLVFVRARLKTMQQTARPLERLRAAHDTAVALFAALAGVSFLLFWTFVYLLIWSLQSSAFSELPTNPRLGEFVFISASGALGGTPEGVRALSAWCRAPRCLTT